MKGITPVIATILMLLITVSIVGIAFTFFSRTTSTATQQVSDQTNQQLAQMSKQVVIDSKNSSAVAIKATGTGTLASTDYNVYVDGALRNCASPASIAPQQVFVCHFGNPPCATGQKVRVTSPANSVEETC